MTILAFASLLAFVLNFSLGAFIYFRDPKSVAHRIFFLTCISIGCFSLVQFGYQQASTYEEAVFAWQFDAVWPIPVALWIHLTLVFTNKTKWLRNRLTYVWIYGPALFFVLGEAFGHLVTGPPVLKPWGWWYGYQETWISHIGYIWVFVVPFFAASILFFDLRNNRDTQKVGQSWILALAGAIPVALQLVDYVVNLWQIELPTLVPFGLFAMNALVAYAIWRYDLFSISIERAALDIIQTMSDSLILVGLNGNIITLNPATSEMTGFKEDELRERPFKMLFMPDAPFPLKRNNEVRNEIHYTLKEQHMETTYRTQSGDLLPVMMSVSVLFGKKQEERAFLVLASDISDLKQTTEKLAKHEEQLEKLVEERTAQLTESTEHLHKEINERQRVQNEKQTLETQLFQAQKMEAIGRLAGGVAHDFNNLLFVINGYCATLSEELPNGSPLIKDVQQIAEAGNRAANLTKQLLAFSRKQVIEPAKININERLEASKKMFARLIGEEFVLRILPAKQLGSVVMDVTQIDQIIANLIINAKDAMPTGGVIMVQTQNKEFTTIDCESKPERQPGKFVQLTIRDRGCGISEENQRMIFEPFFTTKPLGKGTGLGLATVYGIVKQNNGFIEVESTVKKGTAFHIFLPVTEQFEGQENTVWDATAEVRGEELVLLVEDNHMVRRLTNRLLKTNGYKVLEADNGATALLLFAQYSEVIDIVLTDIAMPHMSGGKLVEDLMLRSPDVKVLFMTGNNDELIEVHGINNFRHPIIMKPFSAEDLCRKLRAVLDGRISFPAPPL